MTKDFLATIKRRVVIFDGGMGSMLIAAGLTQREIPEAWLLTKSEKIADVHAAYLQAGAEVVTTATFGASRIKLQSSEAGKKLDPVKVNEKGVEIARKAVEHSARRDAFVAGDIGPTGLFFPPVGTLKAEDARAAFKEQAFALERAGVDIFIIETMYDIREAVEALRAVREVSSRPVVVTLTFDRKPRGFFTMMGDTTEAASEALLKEGASVVGANCSLQSGEMIELAEEFRLVTGAPLLFQPNAGRPVMEHGIPVYKQRPQEFAQDVVKIVAAGANAVGGCCGTTPDFIREIHNALIHGK
ncbi:MAG: homocysteine S-methyltransferase family protein [Candidatus Krumholzibacteriaceae bacterium]|jgi:methionine synthase I (cobalamin-dependent)